MNKEFIPYEQSLELRKLKFDEPCLGFYVGKDKEVFMSSNDFNAPFQFRLDSKTTFVAPTFSQAFKFFREKYMLSGAVIAATISHRDDTMEYTYDIRGKYTTCVFIGVYEQAEIECLKKLIEIVKEKK